MFLSHFLYKIYYLQSTARCKQSTNRKLEQSLTKCARIFCLNYMQLEKDTKSAKVRSLNALLGALGNFFSMRIACTNRLKRIIFYLS